MNVVASAPVPTRGVVGCGLGMKVYTRTGDDGTTGLLYGGRVGKDEVGPEAYGAVDEAVSALGLARAGIDPDSELHELLVQLQRELFVVGAELATAPDNRTKLTPEVSLVTPQMVERLEPVIDDVTGRFEAPKEFVLPGQNPVAAALDFARTVIRRAERVSVAATRVGWLGPESQVVPYLNRLADLVYTLSRWQEGDFRPSRKP
jgi:cob(I)alamin adenosyltransferase